VQDVRWSYGQFSHESLLVSAYIVNKLGEAARKDPGLVARHVTAMMTQQETKPDGMMVGKWEGGFAGGTNPSSWSGSEQIIRQYISRGMRPVSFSQCWVFGAVYQTVSRALGIPTRQVSLIIIHKPKKSL
jgi:transglutaminase 1